MNEASPIRHPSLAGRIGLAALSVLLLIGAVRLAVSTDGPLQVLLACLGFAAYVALFGRAVDAPALHSHGRTS